MDRVHILSPEIWVEDEKWKNDPNIQRNATSTGRRVQFTMCRKNGIPCSAICRNYRGLSSTNQIQQLQDSDDEEDLFCEFIS